MPRFEYTGSPSGGVSSSTVDNVSRSRSFDTYHRMGACPPDVVHAPIEWFIQKFTAASRGRPDVCEASWRSVVGGVSGQGTRGRYSGRCAASGSSRRRTPRSTSCISAVATSTLVMEPAR